MGSGSSLGWDLDGFVSAIQAGKVEDLVSFNPPIAWMQWMLNNFPQTKRNDLRHLCMPGSHDAGMSVFGKSTCFAKECNTRTQTQSILGQLNLGARYFDLRPVISGGKYFTGHYSFIGAINSWQGANGQSIDHVVREINEFTRENAELVILNLSHDLNTDLGNSSYEHFTQGEWGALLESLKKLEFLYVDSDPAVDLSLYALDHYIGRGKACVIVIVDLGDKNISLGEYAGQGFHTNRNLEIYNEYSDTNDLEKMASDQLEKMRNQRKSAAAPCFLLSWTLTQSDFQAITCSFTWASSIRGLAEVANPALPAYLWPAVSTFCYPNILYTDNVNNSDSAALSLAINWLAAQPLSK